MPMRLHEVHPSLVHYPLALLPASIGADLIGLLTGKRKFSRLGRRLMPLAAASAAATGVAGLVAQSEVKAEGAAHDLLVTHRNMNIGLLALTGVLAVARARREPGPGYLLAGIAGVLAMNYSAYLGGKMVYQHGVGVAPAGGVRPGASPELRAGTLGEAARLSAQHAREAVAHTAYQARRGDLFPAVRSGASSSPPTTPGLH